jgi:hypothetical protein
MFAGWAIAAGRGPGKKHIKKTAYDYFHLEKAGLFGPKDHD